MKQTMEGPVLGTIICEQEKYYLKIDDEITELPVGMLTKSEELDKLVGQKVRVIFSEPVARIVGLIAENPTYDPHGILCYYPPPWRLDLGMIIQDEIYIEKILKEMISAGTITEENAQMIRAAGHRG